MQPGPIGFAPGQFGGGWLGQVAAPGDGRAPGRWRVVSQDARANRNVQVERRSTSLRAGERAKRRPLIRPAGHLLPRCGRRKVQVGRGATKISRRRRWGFKRGRRGWQTVPAVGFGSDWLGVRPIRGRLAWPSCCARGRARSEILARGGAGPRPGRSGTCSVGGQTNCQFTRTAVGLPSKRFPFCAPTVQKASISNGSR